MQKHFEPTEAQRAALVTTVEKRFEDERKCWPKETTGNYSFSKDQTGTKTASVVFYIGRKTFSADFKLLNDGCWYCTNDWRD